LAVAYFKLGEAYQRMSDVPSALKYYEKARNRLEKLSDADPTNIQAKAELAAANARSGRVGMQGRNFARAAEYFERGVAILKKLESQGKIKDQPQYCTWLRLQQKDLAICQKAPRAIKDLDFALAQREQAAELLQIRSTVLAERGEHAAAALTA